MSLRPPVLISDLTRVEFASAVGRWARMGEIDESQANLVENTFSRDILSCLFVSRQVQSAHYLQVEKWLSGRKTSLRTLDALHIACSWEFGARLITCDAVMHRSAQLLGVDDIFLES